MRKGFTLLELMVVIVIMGIILAMVIPSISRVFYERSQAVNQVHTILQRARFRAIASQDTFRVEVDGLQNTVALWRGNQRVEGPYQLARNTDLQPDVLFWIFFYNDGTADDGAGNPPQPVIIRYGKNLAGMKTIRVFQASGMATIQ